MGHENPFGMDADEAAMWMSGGALPGSVKFEQAKAAMEWELNQRLRDSDDGSRRWVIVGAIAAVIAAVGSLVAAVASLG